MQLIGMLDSPYVRRVAVSLQLLGLRFEHQPLSVFRAFAGFQRINPVVKAPTLVCDDGEVLMDSTLIIDYAQALAGPRRSLLPRSSVPQLQHCLKTVGLALAACEKSVQILYERQLRPADKQHEPWLSRIVGQALAAYEALEADVRQRPLDATRQGIDQAGISTAVAWHFTQQIIPDVVAPANFPALCAFSADAEALPEFAAAPHGEASYRDPD